MTTPQTEAVAGATPPEPRKVTARGPWALAWRRLRRDKVAMVSGIVIVLIVAMAVFAPLAAHITGHPPNLQYRKTGLTPDGSPIAPNGTFWLGTDDYGRDILVRIAYGARISLLVGLASTVLSVLVGLVLGMMAGFIGGIVDTVIARLIDVVLSIPFLLAAVALVAIYHPSLLITILVIGFFSWASMARIVRGQVLSLREREFIEAARSLGAGTWRIMAVDLVPNLLMPVIVYASLLLPVTIVTEATLSYLGLGVPAPTAEWGGMISEAQAYYKIAWWMLAFPGLALVITTLAFNLFGDGLQDALNPRAGRSGRK